MYLYHAGPWSPRYDERDIHTYEITRALSVLGDVDQQNLSQMIGKHVGGQLTFLQHPAKCKATL